MIELTIDELDHEICSLAARINTATAQLLSLVGEGWAGHGVKSCAQWLSWKCHLGTHAAREQVRVARALRDLPLLRTEFEAGRLSYSKIRALTRVAEPDNEADLTELAASATAAQIERTVAGWRRAETLTDGERRSRQDLSWHFDEHGMLHFAGRLDTEDAAIVLAALEAITAKLATEQAEQPADLRADEPLPEASPQGRFDPPGPTSPSLAAALVGLANAFLNSDRDPNSDPSIQLVVTVDAQALERNACAGLAAFRAGGQLTSEQARRLACDTTLITILKDGSEILDIGRATRTVHRGIRRALMARDRGCAMPGCTEHRPRKLHAHHVWHWADGGPTCLDNLVLLCKTHHHLLHRGAFTITTSVGRFVFRDEAGAVIQPVPALTIAAEPLAAADLEIIPTWAGDPLNLDYVLSTLIQRRDARQQRRAQLEHARAAVMAAAGAQAA